MKKINWFQLLVIVLITELIGVLSSLFSGNTGQIYTSLVKPTLSPPGWIFGVIWPILYLLMGIAVYMIYQSPDTLDRKEAITLYWVQLFVNFLWPVVFFRLGWHWISVLVILILDVLVFMTTIKFYKINKVAGYLLIPYLLWILFATYLNIGIAILN
ncbi:TspO/MBR family protein [Candidatus Clostridium stratigraminis]|uniref:TspO/MBR family protein n=1 Tax=Candidatus Clostridium stratigraminis TaxID=3381661 RepID=A0ABW8T667_9CLOT